VLFAHKVIFTCSVPTQPIQNWSR